MSDVVESKVVGKNKSPVGVAPSVVLCSPKNMHNVGKALRVASCYGFKQTWYTGDRVQLDKGRRLPREERMKGFADVELIQFDFPLDCFPRDATPVAVEVRENAEMLHEFVHPPNPVYVFGPEDGFIHPALLRNCHRFVVIPVHHCLNLANAVATVLWDREMKLLAAGKAPTTPIAYENRGSLFDGEDD